MRRRYLEAFSIVDPDDRPAREAGGEAEDVDAGPRRGRRVADPDLYVGLVAPAGGSAAAGVSDAPEAAAVAGGGRRPPPPPPPPPPRGGARYGLFAGRDFDSGEAVYRAGRDALYFQDDGDWGTFLGRLRDRDRRDRDGDGGAATTDGGGDGIDPGSLACLAAGHSSRRRVSRPGRHLIALDMNEGLFARRIRRRGGGSRGTSPEDQEEEDDVDDDGDDDHYDYDYNDDDDDDEGNVGFIKGRWDIDWRALRNIAAGEEIVVEEGEFTIAGSFEEEDEEENLMDRGWMETAESVYSDEEMNAAMDVSDEEDDIEGREVKNTYPEDEGDNTVENEEKR